VFEIIQRVRDDRAEVRKEVEGDTALYSGCSTGLLILTNGDRCVDVRLSYTAN
jgi:hypothetical protein